MYPCPQDPMFFYRDPSSLIPTSPQRPSFDFEPYSIYYQRPQPYMMSTKPTPYISDHSPPTPASSHSPALKFSMQQILRRPEESPHYQDPSSEILNSMPVYFRLKPTLRTPSGRRCRKSRTVFTDLQLRYLEKTFSEQKYLDTSSRGKLAQTLGLNETQVKTWFQNRRMKWKKENKSSITEDSTADSGDNKPCNSDVSENDQVTGSENNHELNSTKLAQ